MGKLPPQAKRVFKGDIFDVYQWEQTLFDGTTHTFEMLKRPNTLNVIALVGDKIIINDEEQPSKGTFYALPGGRQDEEDTSPLEGVKRELLEETGYSSNDWQEWSAVDPYTKMEWTVYTFIARKCKKIQDPELDPGEKITPLLVDVDEFFNIVLTDKFRDHGLKQLVLEMMLYPEKKEAFKQLLFPHV